uniref:GTP cyclohydrolase 1 n=1 Tax=Macrostomum lignano TaxID=282301 RepID=A0A1I8FA77_9PLAT
VKQTVETGHARGGGLLTQEKLDKAYWISKCDERSSFLIPGGGPVDRLRFSEPHNGSAWAVRDKYRQSAATLPHSRSSADLPHSDPVAIRTKNIRNIQYDSGTRLVTCSNSNKLGLSTGNSTSAAAGARSCGRNGGRRAVGAYRQMHPNESQQPHGWELAGAQLLTGAKAKPEPVKPPSNKPRGKHRRNSWRRRRQNAGRWCSDRERQPPMLPPASLRRLLRRGAAASNAPSSMSLPYHTNHRRNLRVAGVGAIRSPDTGRGSALSAGPPCQRQLTGPILGRFATPIAAPGALTTQGAYFDAEREPAAGRHVPTLTRRIITCVGEDNGATGTAQTPERAAKADAVLYQGIRETIARHFKRRVFDENHEETGSREGHRDVLHVASTTCGPFMGKVSIGLPAPICACSASANSLESLRCTVVDCRCKSALTKQIALALMEAIRPAGVAVVVQATHMCMVMRGVQKHQHAARHTSSMLGVFREDTKIRDEFHEPR